LGEGPGLDEFALIERLFAPLATDPGAFGLKDDAATVSLKPGEDLVVTKDAMVAGIHFFENDPPDLIARKLMRVNLSDLAAKGAVPYGYLLATAFPKGTSLDWLDGFAAGLAADQAEFGFHLLGGDTVATSGPLTLSLTALGTLPKGSIIRRGGGRPGDDVYVSGTIGDAVLGLAALKGEALGLSEPERAALIDRYHLPRPRLALGQGLRGLARAGLDVSDGLIADLGHLAAVSGVKAVFTLGATPLSPPARAWADRDTDRWLRLAGGGDDYELLFAAPQGAEARLSALALSAGTAVAKVGRLETGAGVVTLDLNGAPVEASHGGYRHF
jgi:thiamine-monophosphate kinase